ncbi:MAG: C69 family dipeptidase [Bacteroidales bacterium]|nr:C69 family dipeptidase [Candidatus Colimorpha onthohippi]
MKKIIYTGVLALALGVGYVASACTNFLFTKGATKDGSTMITYAADSHTLYGELYYRKVADYPAGTMFMLYDWDSGRPLFEIPQVAHTYSVVGNMNEHQLAIGETTYGGRPLSNKVGIDYGSLIYVTLQRAKNAREAIQVMANLVAEYGYCSSGESFSIADPNEVWIMELIGKGEAPCDTIKGVPVVKKEFKKINCKGAVWVARRIPDGYVCGHANQARITTFPLEVKKSHKSITSKNFKYLYEPEVECVYSEDVITFARAKGYFDGKDEDFSFADAYAPLSFGGMRGCDARVYAMFARVKSGIRDQYADYALGRNPDNRLPLWIKPDHQVTVREVMNLMRDHYEGTPLDMSQDCGGGPFNCPYRWRPMDWKSGDHSYVHERATSTQQTGFSFVAQCRSWLPAKIGGILWFGVDDTYSTVYCPMYCGITEIPECFRVGNGDMITYSETSAFWLFNRVTNFVYSRYKDMIVDLQRVQNRLEDGFVADVAKNDARVKNASEAELATLLNDFSGRQAAKMMKDWKWLDQFLLVKYIDGNIKHDDNGVFKRDQYGHAEWPDQPEYPAWFYKQIVEDHGDVIIEK